MSLLFEEIFRKISKVGKGHMTLGILIRVLFFIIIAGILFLLVYSLISGNYWIFCILGGGFILAEVAHMIRKSREKVMVKKAGFKKKGRREFLKNEKTKNKQLLSSSKPKNKQLLKDSSRNKQLLKK